MGEINQKPYEKELDYLYGRYDGESALDKKIVKAEAEINNRQRLQEELLEKMFDHENFVRLQKTPQKDWTFRDCEIYNSIRKKYENVGKDFSGNDLNDVATPAGAVQDTSALNNKIINTCNGLISKLPAGYSVQPLQQGASLQNILGFVRSYRDALKNGQHPESPEIGAEIEPQVEPQDIQLSDNHKVKKSAPKYTLAELKATRIELERMIAEQEY